MEGDHERGFSTLNLRRLFSATAATMLLHSPEHYSRGMATPPLSALVSVPFKWEEEPGKPRPSIDIVARPEPTRCLELPPCRLLETTKTHSPTAVLDGPYVVGRPKFSSFRFFNREALDSFDSSSSCSLDDSAVDLLLGKKKARGFFGRNLRSRSGCWMKADGRSSSASGGVGDGSWTRVTDGRRMRRHRSLYSLPQGRSPTNFWAVICESFKQAIPWKSTRNSKKEGST